MVANGLLLIGDAAGLAYPESGEGIRPAIESGILAARTLIAAGGRHRLEDLLPYAASIGRLHPHIIGAPPLLRSVQTPIGRALLRSPLLTRHIVLDRWFLRRQGATGR